MANIQRACATLPAADLVRARRLYDSRGAWLRDSEGNVLVVTQPSGARQSS